jgi:hypothetical protein
MALFKTDYEEGRLQPTPGGHPQLAIPRANSPFYWLIICDKVTNRAIQKF